MAEKESIHCCAWREESLVPQRTFAELQAQVANFWQHDSLQKKNRSWLVRNVTDAVIPRHGLCLQDASITTTTATSIGEYESGENLLRRKRNNMKTATCYEVIKQQEQKESNQSHENQKGLINKTTDLCRGLRQSMLNYGSSAKNSSLFRTRNLITRFFF